MKKNIVLSILVNGALLVIIAFLFLYQSGPSLNDSVSVTENVNIKDGIQYVTITAQGGYYPRTSTIQSNMLTKIIVQTNGTYDCSASLGIRSVGFQKVLQPTGEEIIDIGTPKSGENIQGVCSMGMYSFQINAL